MLYIPILGQPHRHVSCLLPGGAATAVATATDNGGLKSAGASSFSEYLMPYIHIKTLYMRKCFCAYC